MKLPEISDTPPRIHHHVVFVTLAVLGLFGYSDGCGLAPRR